MANVFLALPAPAGNSAGAAVDVSSLGAKKTIVVEGNGSGEFEPFVIIEVSNDAGGVNWSTLTQFQKPGEATFCVACRWMRARTTNYRQGGAPVVNVGGVDDGTSFATLVAPAGNGDGAGVDVSALPPFKTVQVTGAFRGAIAIEVSNDGGTTYSPAMVFLPDQNGIRTGTIVADYMRVSRSGIAPGPLAAGTPDIDVGASAPAGGSSSSTVIAGNVFTFRPGSAFTGPVIFNDFDDLYAELVVQRTAADDSGIFTIVFDSSVAPCTLAGGTYDMDRVIWRSYKEGVAAAVVVSFIDGTQIAITNLHEIIGLEVQNNSTSPNPAIQLEANAEGIALTLTGSKIINPNGDGPVIEVISDSATIYCMDQSEIGSDATEIAITLPLNGFLIVTILGENCEVFGNAVDGDASTTVELHSYSTTALMDPAQGAGGITASARSHTPVGIFNGNPNGQLIGVLGADSLDFNTGTHYTCAGGTVWA